MSFYSIAAAVCHCPPYFANESVIGTVDWSDEVWSKCLEDTSTEEMEFFAGTEITYSCPMGHVFEIPEIYGNGTSVLKLTCEAYAAWNPDVIPKCVRE